MNGTDAEEAFGPPLDARHLFAQARSALLDLLTGLGADEWDRPTAAAPWAVRDVVAHLVGDDVGRLSRSRDRHVAPAARPHESLPELVHRLNHEWVTAAARISPVLLVDLLRTTTPQVMDFWQRVDLGALGEPVSWAGPGAAPVWLDGARDFTEDWVHQQQIRRALGRPGADEPAMVHAVLETFVRAVPYTLDRRAPAPGDGAPLTVHVPGPAGGTWTWRPSGKGWIWTRRAVPATTSVTLGADDLWKVCVRMIEPAEAAARAEVHGDAHLADAVLHTVSVIR